MTISATTQGLRPGVCTSTSRPSTPFDGQVIYETDTDNALVWNGTAWVYLATASTRPVGIQTMIPTSVDVAGAGSSASVGSYGKVTFSAATSVSLNGCFTSAFTNYRVVCDFDASASAMDVRARLRVGGTDNSTASSYIRQEINGNNTTLGGNRVTTDVWRLGGGSSNYTNGFSADIYRPFLADSTACFTNSANSELNPYITIASQMHTQNTSYDGLSLIASTGTITGAVYVYGYGE